MLPRRLATDRAPFLDLDQVRNLTNAVAYTHDIGEPLTVHMILIWAHVAGWRAWRLTELRIAVLQNIDRWLRRRSRRRTSLRAVWVQENGPKKGIHLHAMLNIPPKLTKPLQAHLDDTFAISPGGLMFTGARYGMRTPKMQTSVLKYLLKSFDPTAFRYVGLEPFDIAPKLGIRPDVSSGGRVDGKRCGTTENIGLAARGREGWPELRTVEQLADALNPKDRRRFYQWPRNSACNLQSENPSHGGLGDGEDFAPTDADGRERQSPGNHETAAKSSFVNSTRTRARAEA